MKKLILTAAAICASLPATAAILTNTDGVERSVVITEGGSQTELALDPGESQTVCAAGCFMTMPNGDREALTGSETIEIKDGRAEYK